MKPMKIAEFVIDDAHEVFVIAEVGINHNGQLSLAKEMAMAAKEAGASCVKFQTHIVDKEMIHTDMPPGKISAEPLWDIIKRCSLSAAEERELKEYCDRIGILFLSTPFSREAADQLEKLNVPAFKIGSGELTTLPLIEHIARKGKPLILSTGMAEWHEIAETADLLRQLDVPFALLQCTSSYPSRYEEVRLGAIPIMKQLFGVPVGLSDHSPDAYTAIGAVAVGALIVEKHITLDRKLPGPDQGFSIEPSELRELVRGVRAVKAAMRSDRAIQDVERPVMQFARASVVAIRDIPAGEALSLDNVWVKRPGTGAIPARDFRRVLGRRAKVSLRYDHQLNWNEIE